MATVLTEGRYAVEFLMSELNGHQSRASVVIAAGAGVLAAGTVLGKVTASGKYKASPDTGATGEQVAAGVLSYRVDASGGSDVPAGAILRGAEVNSNMLAYEATVNDATKRGAKATQLAAVGIIVR